MFSFNASGTDTEGKLYVDDVFSTWLYPGNGSTQTITNGIDLAGKGGLVAAAQHIVAASVDNTDQVEESDC